MRKIIIITNVWLMSLLLVISMTGCAQDTANPASASITTDGAICSGAACVPLSTAGNFTILAQSTITNIPSSSVFGNVGLSPATAAGIQVTCAEMTGTVYGIDAFYPGTATCYAGTAPDKTLVDIAVGDKTTAFNLGTDNGVFPISLGAYLNVGTPAGTITALTPLPAGVYDWNGADENVLISENITISGSATDVWIFRTSGTLVMASNMKITLGGSAQAANIFWIISGTVTIDTGAEFKGVVLSNSSITMNSGSKITGRLLSKTQVSLNTSTVTKP